MAEKQVMIAVSEGLRDWLRDEARRLEAAWEHCHYLTPSYNPQPANATRPHVSLAAVIEIMLEERLRHRQRRRAYKRSRPPRARRLPPARLMQLPDVGKQLGHDQAGGELTGRAGEG